jgi:tetratricopeptide (TPR) repeat protein
VIKFVKNIFEKIAASHIESYAAFRKGKELYETYLKFNKYEPGSGIDNPLLLEAYDCYQKAERLSCDEKRFDNAAMAQVELGMVAELLGNFDNAVAHRRKAISMFEAMPELSGNHIQELQYLYVYLAKILYHMNEKEEALDLAKKTLAKYERTHDIHSSSTLKELIDKIENE